MDNLIEFYKTLDEKEFYGKDAVMSINDYYISESGEIFCYAGVILKDKKIMDLEAMPYYFHGKKSEKFKDKIFGFIKIKNGCILKDHYYCDVIHLLKQNIAIF
ncbi:MAG: hypothetical protein PHV79_00235 [Clostridia bacterium]|jgi:hypothetical protein|nr:hypothetical protein [Clostridia bacterium]